MPFYHATVRPGLLSSSAREGFANDVVAVHCGVTGAPPSFVHVLITEDTNGALPEGSNAVVAGVIRAGRTDEQKAEIVSELTESVSDALGLDAAEVAVVTVDIPSRWNMEGGELLPEPGEEAAWLERHRS